MALRERSGTDLRAFVQTARKASGLSVHSLVE